MRTVRRGTFPETLETKRFRNFIDIEQGLCKRVVRVRVELTRLNFLHNIRRVYAQVLANCCVAYLQFSLAKVSDHFCDIS
jgi:hypothetical protein